MCDMKFAAKFAAKFAFNPRFMNVNQNPPEMLYVFSLAKAKVFPIVVDFHFFFRAQKESVGGTRIVQCTYSEKDTSKSLLFHSAISKPRCCHFFVYIWIQYKRRGTDHFGRVYCTSKTGRYCHRNLKNNAV